MSGSDWLSVVAVLMALYLGAVSFRRLGRMAVPLTLLALMAATGSMERVNEWLISLLVLPVHTGWQCPTLYPRLYNAIVCSRLYPLSYSYGSGILAIIVILRLIVRIRRLPS